jgi:hypothetical protein
MTTCSTITKPVPFERLMGSADFMTYIDTDE